MTGAVRFADAVRQNAHQNQSWLCLGLDPDPARLPAGIASDIHGIALFCKEIIEATRRHVAAYKLNFAFYEALGAEGWSMLQQVREAVPAGMPVIADAKRGDIPNTSRAYASAIFEKLRFDAVTVTPYVGWDGLAPFTAHAGKGVFVVCKTSNPGASDLQDRLIDGEPLYLWVARHALSLKSEADIGLVIGATQPEALRTVRALSSSVLILAPGVGSQGASAAEASALGANPDGDNLLANVSRSVLYASTGTDFAAAAARVSVQLAAETWLKGAQVDAGR
jgi:orotidine-5'-phosphate decarboxylase